MIGAKQLCRIRLHLILLLILHYGQETHPVQTKIYHLCLKLLDLNIELGYGKQFNFLEIN